MSSLDAFFDGLMERHAESVARGEHDAGCEYEPRFYLCHCSKRRREAEGYTTPPGPLEYRAPDCPRCGREVDFDGDGYECRPCHAAWGTGFEAEAHFTDDHGDLSDRPSTRSSVPS